MHVHSYGLVCVNAHSFTLFLQLLEKKRVEEWCEKGDLREKVYICKYRVPVFLVATELHRAYRQESTYWLVRQGSSGSCSWICRAGVGLKGNGVGVLICHCDGGYHMLLLVRTEASISDTWTEGFFPCAEWSFVTLLDETGSIVHISSTSLHNSFALSLSLKKKEKKKKRKSNLVPPKQFPFKQNQLPTLDSRKA